MFNTFHCGSPPPERQKELKTNMGKVCKLNQRQQNKTLHQRKHKNRRVTKKAAFFHINKRRTVELDCTWLESLARLISTCKSWATRTNDSLKGGAPSLVRPSQVSPNGCLVSGVWCARYIRLQPAPRPPLYRWTRLFSLIQFSGVLCMGHQVGGVRSTMPRTHARNAGQSTSG